MPAALPALNLIAEPGRRRATLDTAREIERRGFAGISVSSSFGWREELAPLCHNPRRGRGWHCINATLFQASHRTPGRGRQAMS